MNQPGRPKRDRELEDERAVETLDRYQRMAAHKHGFRVQSREQLEELRVRMGESESTVDELVDYDLDQAESREADRF